MRGYVAGLSIVVGAGMIGIWTFMLLRRQVKEIAEGKRSIRFHIAAELGTAVVLVAAGIALLSTDASWAWALAAVGLGALLYTSVNSPGYYADLGQTSAVAMFGVLTVLTAVGAIGIITVFE